MVETQEDSVETQSTKMGVSICCPRCKSQNVVLGESKEGYYWVVKCNNCGYEGKEGKQVGCLDKKNEPTHVREE